MQLKKGAKVEVCSEEQGFVGSWYTAFVLSWDRNECTVEYEHLVTEDNEHVKLQEVLRRNQLRPIPKALETRQWRRGDRVEAYDREGWWEGVISKVLPDKSYYVYFRESGEELSFRASDIRVHQEWKDGRWIVSQVRASPDAAGYGSTSCAPVVSAQPRFFLVPLYCSPSTALACCNRC